MAGHRTFPMYWLLAASASLALLAVVFLGKPQSPASVDHAGSLGDAGAEGRRGGDPAGDPLPSEAQVTETETEPTSPSTGKRVAMGGPKFEGGDRQRAPLDPHGQAGLGAASGATPVRGPQPRDAGIGFDEQDARVEREIWKTDKEGIRGAIREVRGDLRECYEAWAQMYPDLGGRVSVGFTIDQAPPDEAHGAEAASEEVLAQVTNVEIKDTSVEHAFFEGCVLGVVSELRFHPPHREGGVQVTYPFMFKAHKE